MSPKVSAKLFQVVTFAADPLSGNPAFVLCETGGASDHALQGACAGLGADVTAVLDGVASDRPQLRFFTPLGPHPGAGHATLAAAHVALRSTAGRNDGGNMIVFRLANGEERRARAADGRIAVDFPLMPASRTDLAGSLGQALGAKPLETWVAPFGHVAIFADQDTVAGLRPNLDRVAALDRSAVIVTAPGGPMADVVIRVFAPKVGLPEDPVCGTAHRIIIPYWAGRLGKTRLHSRQLSARGGDLWCEVDGDRVVIAGESELVVEGTMKLSEA